MITIPFVIISSIILAYVIGAICERYENKKYQQNRKQMRSDVESWNKNLKINKSYKK